VFELDELMSKAISHALHAGVSFAEARGEDTAKGYIEAVNEEIRTVTQIHNIGIGVRVFHGKGTGFSFTSVLEEKEVLLAVDTAVKIAKASTRRTLVSFKLAEVKPIEETRTTKVSRHPMEVSLEEKKNLCVRQCQTARAVNKQIANTSSMFGEYHGTLSYVNSEGTKVSYEPLLIGLRCTCVAKKASVIVDAWDDHGGSVGLDTFEDEEHSPETIAGNAAGWALEKLKAKVAPTGNFDAFIDPSLAGVLAHESFGHLSEADLTTNSAFNGKLNQIVASEGVYMTDDGTMPGNLGTSRYDDEGTPSSRVAIIKGSVLTELLTNREYAAKTGLRPTGNARAESYLYPPIIRMRNTFFERGDAEPSELFEGIDFGYYCADFRGGQAQTNASFQVGLQEVYEIVNGKLGRPVTDLSISGIATDSLMKIEMISKKEFPFELGRCGKGQEAFVSSGGPDVRFAKGGITFGGKT